MEPDNITICAALMLAGHTQVGMISRIMAIDYDHARSLIAQVKENGDVERSASPHPGNSTQNTGTGTVGVF